MTKLELFTHTLDYVNMGYGVYEIAKVLNIDIQIAGELVLLAYNYNGITI